MDDSIMETSLFIHVVFELGRLTSVKYQGPSLTTIEVLFKNGKINLYGLNIEYFKIYKTIILPVVLYDCETCSLTLR